MKESHTRPAISVVIPVYNAETYLRETIDGIFGQTFSNFELICVDDGSTDNSLEILHEYAAAHPNMTVIHQSNRGPGAARNRGLDAATGEYLAMLDADDLYDPHMLEQAYAKAHAEQSDIVVYASDEYYPDTQTFVPAPWTINRALLPTTLPFAATDVKQGIFHLFLGWTWDKLFRMDFIRQHKLHFQPLRSSDDAFFCFMAIAKAERISIIDQILVHHRIARSGSVSTTRDKSWPCFYRALLAMREQLKTWHLYKRFEQDYINYALHFSLWHLTTLNGEAYEACYQKLKHEWWPELGVTKHPADYFYNVEEYATYERIMSQTASEFRTQALQSQLDKLHASSIWKAGQAVTFVPRKLKSLYRRLRSSR